ncbi:MAG TPA: hypothetical protein VED67_00620 [Thermodesulfovibrionales bacterium]|nr:hypothetical protein [Thermodesulfovibrionales bacterium]
MKSSLIIIVLVLTGLLLAPMAFAETAQGTAGKAPISQPLVREGALAVKLVDSLKIGSTRDEAQAERMLVTVGVAPLNGWIADYPVTPDIVGELRNAIGDAADSRQLSIGKEEAMKAFDDVMVAYGLSVNPSAPNQVGGNVPSYSPDTTAINNYYYDEGPPVVTYYAPPPDYAYLYSWVPYPFWWWDFWFPGFFVLADFDIGVHGHGHHHDGHHGEFITNHFRDPGTGRMSRIDPAQRVSGGTSAGSRVTGWSSPSARSSAQAIFNRSHNVAMAGGTGKVYDRSSGTRGTISGALSGRTFKSPSVMRGTTGPSWGGNRTFNTSSVNRRTFTLPSGGGRTFSAPQVSRRSFSQSSYSGSRSFSAPSVGRFFGSSSVGRLSGGSFGSGRSFGSTGSFGGGRR